MTDTGAIRATFSDWKTVKTRKVLQLIFEVGLERQAEVLAILGAPMPDAETWVGIARVQGHRARSDATTAETSPATPEDGAAATERRQAASERGKALYAETDAGWRAVTRAAILCNDPRFWEWCRRTDAAGARLHILMTCYIDSRREIGTNPEALARFERMETDFDIWAGRLPDPRRGDERRIAPS